MKKLTLFLILGFLIIPQYFGLIVLLNYISLKNFPLSWALSFWFPRNQIFDIFGYPGDLLFFSIVILYILILLELVVLLILITDLYFI